MPIQIIKSIFTWCQNEVVTLAHLQHKYPQAQFDYHHGYIDLNDETVIKRIKRFDPDYIFVGMGFPKQEEWIQNIDTPLKEL